MYLTIFHSIENHQILHFFYDGYFRIVEPHVFGVSHHGRDVLYGYQVGGADANGEHVGWESFYVADIQNIQSLGAHFEGPREGFALGEMHWRRIYTQIRRRGAPHETVA